MGINLGDIIKDGRDIHGDGVNVAARLEALAEPGGICVSRVVRDQVRDKLAFSFEDMGEQQVKNIARPVRVHRILLGLNVRAAFIVAQAATRLMVTNGSGVIINMSSQMGHVGSERDRTVYVMTKHALEGLTKAMAVELAPKGVRVVSIAPTFVETPLSRPFLDDPDTRKWILGRIPLGRVGTVEDVASAVVFLASPAAALVTGSSLLVRRLDRMVSRMRRRNLLAMIGAVLASPPLAAGAQQRTTPTIGILLYNARTQHGGEDHLLILGLRDVGLVDGKTVKLLLREAEGQVERLPQLAAELIAAKPDVLVSAGPQPIAALARATSTIPIVMAIVSDPVTYGYARSLAHPGGNLTGLSMVNTELSSKRIDLLRQASPEISRLAVFTDPTMGPQGLPETAAAAGTSVSTFRCCRSLRTRSKKGLPRLSAPALRLCSSCRHRFTTCRAFDSSSESSLCGTDCRRCAKRFPICATAA